MDREGLEAKYVVCVRRKREVIIVFSFSIRHDTFANLDPIRAGFVSFENGEAKCFGKSISLGLTSNEELDSHLATKYILNK